MTSIMDAIEVLLTVESSTHQFKVLELEQRTLSALSTVELKSKQSSQREIGYGLLFGCFQLTKLMEDGLNQAR
jgi:hypothetical protein